MLFRTAARFGTSLPIPNVPAGTGVVLHGQLQKVKVFLETKQFLFFYASMFTGGILGNQFYDRFILNTNPANPPRWADEKNAERHPHAPEDE